MKKKIGILTFHHVTNYGAVLQCYALQTYLNKLGYNTEIINYKPRKNDDNLFNFLRFRKFKDIDHYILTRRKEQQLRNFREKYLVMNPSKLRTIHEVAQYVKNFDILISGSDQVLNPSALLYSEAYGGKGKICPIYYLGFPFQGKKIGYALSFGVIQYPEPQLSIAKKYIHSFNKLSVRENSGINIIKSMGRTDAVLTPDPTFLQESSFYHNLADSYVNVIIKPPYIFCFFLRNIKQNKKSINKYLTNKTTLWNNDDCEYSLQGWLHKIKHASYVITDSFHCMVMCLKFHTPFAVITKFKGIKAMNDRFYTILKLLNMENHIVNIENISKIDQLMKSTKSIIWDEIDQKLTEYTQAGIKFLNKL